MLEIINASLKLGGKELFKGLTFSLKEGDVVCIRGNSGCGKTTLLKAILGFLPLDEGVISCNGEPINAESAEVFRGMMTYIPQELALPSENVADMVKLPFTLKANRERKYSKLDLMKEWGKLNLSEDLYDKKVSQLSGGQRQRIMISVSGMLGKLIILADEPTSALDAETSALVADYFQCLAAKGAIVVAVSHDNNFANRCNMIVNI